MHAYSRFIQDRLDALGLTAAKLSRKSDIPEPTLSKILKDPDERLAGMPDEETVKKLAHGLEVDPGVIVAVAATARYGVPVGDVVEVPSATRVSDDELVQQVVLRLRAKSSAPVLDIDQLEHRAVTDIIDLMLSLRADAEASDAEGKAGLATAQRFLADQLEAAINASAARSATARRTGRPARHA